MNPAAIEAEIARLKHELSSLEKKRDLTAISQTRARLADLNRRLDQLEKALRDE